jgi:hypothetical protein
VKVALIGHSDDKKIAVGNDAKPDTNISSSGGTNDVAPSSLDWSNLTSDATIDILGCDAGNGIAQEISNAAGVDVTAPNTYLNFNESAGALFIRWFRFGKMVRLLPQ